MIYGKMSMFAARKNKFEPHQGESTVYFIFEKSYNLDTHEIGKQHSCGPVIEMSVTP